VPRVEIEAGEVVVECHVVNLPLLEQLLRESVKGEVLVAGEQVVTLEERVGVGEVVGLELVVVVEQGPCGAAEGRGEAGHGSPYAATLPIPHPGYIRRGGANRSSDGEYLRDNRFHRTRRSDAMVDVNAILADTAAPSDRLRETLDARELPPPQPLKNTLELLADLDEETLLVQRNDRAPQHLYPKLEDRGYEYETVDDGDEVVTVVWRE